MEAAKLETLVQTTRRLLRRGAYSNVKKLLSKVHPADIASLVERLEGVDQDKAMELVWEHPQLLKIFSQLSGPFLEQYIDRHQNYDLIVEVIQKIPSDDRTQILGHLSETVVAEILSRMKVDKSQEAAGLLEYAEDVAGRLMSTEVIRLKESTTVAQAIAALQQGQSSVSSYYIYVVDDFENLTGVLSIRQLFQGTTQAQLKDLMFRDVVRVRVTDKHEEVARVVAQYDLVAVPVVDDQGRLKGVITVDDVIDVIQEEAAEQAFKMSELESNVLDEDLSFLDTLKQRLPWFFVMLVGGMFTCEIIDYYSGYLPTVGIFAGFIPVILRIGGIIAKQTSTLMIQGLGSERGFTVKVWRLLWRQIRVTLFISLISSLVVGVYAASRFKTMTGLPMAVGVALCASMLVALVLGALIPMGLKKVKLDAAYSTGWLINFVLDVLGLVIYFKVLVSMIHLAPL